MRANEQKTHVLRRTQTFVGLMCWFAAKYTRSPLRRRLARSASRPMPRRSGELKSVIASARVRRSLRATLSVMLSSAGSCRDTMLTLTLALRIRHSPLRSRRPPDGERHVVAAEPERVRERDAHRPLHRLVGRGVEVAGRV